MPDLLQKVWDLIEPPANFTNITKQTMSLLSGPQLPRCGLCSLHWRWNRSQVQTKTKSLRISQQSIKTIRLSKFETWINIYKNLSWILSTEGLWTFSGKYPTCTQYDGLQLSDKALLNKNDATTTFEYLWFCTTKEKVSYHRESFLPNKKVQSENYDLTETPDDQVWKRKAEVGNNKSRQPGVIKLASYQQINLPRDPFVLDTIHVNIFWKKNRTRLWPYLCSFIAREVLNTVWWLKREQLCKLYELFFERRRIINKDDLPEHNHFFFTWFVARDSQ